MAQDKQHRRSRKVARYLAIPVVTSAVAPYAVAASSHDSAATVPAAVRSSLDAAAQTCPDVPNSVLAAQLRAASGFDPLTATPSGARGIAAFTPEAWTSWGRDADGDGVRSALDPADAIDAHARRMCSLYHRAVGSEISGDRLQLALAAYDAGWSAVVAARGIPAGSRAYVEQIWESAEQYEPAPPAKAFGTRQGHTLPLPTANPHGPAKAMSWARAQVQGDPKWYKLCLNFMAQSYGWSYSGTRYAIDHWWVVPSDLRRPMDRNPPPGALMYWDTGLRPGHVALYLGSGMIASNDIGSPGAISVVPASTVESKWNARYLGWSAPYFPGGGFD